MQKNKNRKGLALGAMVSLVASMFVGVAPASANTGSVQIIPFAGTTYNMIHGEGFNLAYVGDTEKRLSIQVVKPGNVDLEVAFSASATAIGYSAANTATNSLVAAPATSSAWLLQGSTYSSSVINQIFVRPVSGSAITTMSASITVTVNVFEDIFADGKWDTANEPGRTQNVVFHPWSALGGAVNAISTQIGDNRVTASATVDRTTVNVQQLNGAFYFRVGAPSMVGSLSSAAMMGSDVATDSPTALTAADFAAGIDLSVSTKVLAAALAASQTVSAQLYYSTDSGRVFAATTALTAPRIGTVAAKNYEVLTFSAAAGSTLKPVTAGTALALINSAFTVNAFASTGSGKSQVAVTTNTSLYFTVSPAIAAGETLTVHGRVVTGSNNVATAALPLTLTGGTALAISSTGLTEARTLTLSLTKNNETATYVVTIEPHKYQAEVDGAAYFATAPGTAVEIPVTVKDQFGNVSNRPLQRVSASMALTDGSVSQGVATALVNGKSVVTVTPAPATKTGSATVTLIVEHQNPDTGVWAKPTINTNTNVAVEVSALLNGFTASPDVTASASISYALATGKYSWSNAISGSTIVAGAVVTVAGAGLVFSADGGTTTASDSLTFRSGDKGKFFVNIAGTKAGEYEITFTAGSVTATSTLTIDPAAANAGKTITVTGPATASPNRTLTYTGSVVDALGNPVADGDVTITVLGPVSLITGATGVTTDVDGEFTFRVQTAANDEGDISVTATYNKDAKLTLAKDKISAVALTTVALPVVVTADKVTVTGSATLTTGLSTDVLVTVVDAAGNPLAGRSVSLRSSGPGFLNVQSAVSDAAGQVVVKFIATSQVGQVVVTAVVDGKVGTHTLNVVAPVVVVPEINAVIGTFNGRWAVGSSSPL